MLQNQKILFLFSLNLRLPKWAYVLFIPLILILFPINYIFVNAKPQEDVHLYLPMVFNEFEQRTLLCTPTGGSGGFPPGTYDTIIAGSPTTIIVGENYDSQQPTFLAFYLHGDEGGYDNHTDTSNPIHKHINENNWIYVAPQAPSTGDGYYRWSRLNILTADPNAQLIIDVLDHMFNNYNVCQNILFGGSVSGGSAFFDGYFLPTYGDQYSNVFMNLNCGSSGIREGWWASSLYTRLNNLSKNQTVLENYDIHYTMGTEDFLYQNALIAVATYQGLGFDVSTNFIEGAGHCTYGTATEIAYYWASQYNNLTVPDLQ